MFVVELLSLLFLEVPGSKPFPSGFITCVVNVQSASTCARKPRLSKTLLSQGFAASVTPRSQTKIRPSGSLSRLSNAKVCVSRARQYARRKRRRPGPEELRKKFGETGDKEVVERVTSFCDNVEAAGRQFGPGKSTKKVALYGITGATKVFRFIMTEMGNHQNGELRRQQ